MINERLLNTYKKRKLGEIREEEYVSRPRSEVALAPRLAATLVDDRLRVRRSLLVSLNFNFYKLIRLVEPITHRINWGTRVRI